MVVKGPVTIDGASLHKPVGASVNIETDIIARHLETLLHNR